MMTEGLTPKRALRLVTVSPRATTYDRTTPAMAIRVPVALTVANDNPAATTSAVPSETQTTRPARTTITACLTTTILPGNDQIPVNPDIYASAESPVQAHRQGFATGYR